MNQSIQMIMKLLMATFMLWDTHASAQLGSMELTITDFPPGDYCIAGFRMSIAASN
jgi:hypothetical protein